ncbi:hypothetical protein [Devosia sp.]
MHKILNWIAATLAALLQSDPPDAAFDALTPQQWADLPPHHPCCDQACCV